MYRGVRRSGVGEGGGTFRGRDEGIEDRGKKNKQRGGIRGSGGVEKARGGIYRGSEEET